MSEEKQDISGLLGIVAGLALMVGGVLAVGGGWMAWSHFSGGGPRRAKARADVAAAEAPPPEASGPKVHTAADAAALEPPEGEEALADDGSEAAGPGAAPSGGPSAPPSPAADAELDALLDAQAADVEADAAEDAPVVAAAKAGKGKGKKRAPGECRVDSPDIAAVGPGRYQITRDFLERYTGDLSGAESLADVWWAKNGAGEIVGFRIRKIPCKSPLREAGFKPGDVIRSVNGREIRSTGAAVKAYRALRRGDTLVVRLRRDKAWKEQTYEVVDGPLAPAAPAPAAPAPAAPAEPAPG